MSRIADAVANLRNLTGCVRTWDPSTHNYGPALAEADAAADALRGVPDPADLVAIMREVRDSSSFVLNPHERTCIGGGRDGICDCSRARRHTAAWRKFHDALAAAGVPSLVEIEAGR